MCFGVQRSLACQLLFLSNQVILWFSKVHYSRMSQFGIFLCAHVRRALCTLCLPCVGQFDALHKAHPSARLGCDVSCVCYFGNCSLDAGMAEWSCLVCNICCFYISGRWGDWRWHLVLLCALVLSANRVTRSTQHFHFEWQSAERSPVAFAKANILCPTRRRKRKEGEENNLHSGSIRRNDNYYTYSIVMSPLAFTLWPSSTGTK